MNDKITVKQLFNIVDDTNIGFKNPQRGRVYGVDGLAPAIYCFQGGNLEPKIVVCGTIGTHQRDRIYSTNGISPCINSVGCDGGYNNQPKIIETMELYDCIYWNKSPNFQRPPLKNIGRTVTTDTHAPAVVVNNKSNMAKETNINLPEELKGKKFRIRKLTPTECLRLMGCDEETICTMTHCGLSNSALYKLAGNSIVVDVLYHIFRKMFIETEMDIEKDKPTQLELF